MTAGEGAKAPGLTDEQRADLVKWCKDARARLRRALDALDERLDAVDVMNADNRATIAEMKRERDG